AKGDRTGTGTRSLFGRQIRYDLSQGFPLITTKRVHTRSIILELLWFLRGDTNVRWQQQRGASIWDRWARRDRGLGAGCAAPRRAVARLAPPRRRGDRPARRRHRAAPH